MKLFDKKGWRLGIAAAAVLYVLGFVAWRVALATLDTTQFWQLEVSRIFAVWFFAPLILLLPAALLTRQWWVAGALGVPLAVFVAVYGHLWLPAPTRVAAIDLSPQLRVMSWNTQRTADEQQTFVAAVREIEPDVIALQEVRGALSDSVRALDSMYPYRSSSLTGGREGLMILSRWPITEEIADADWLGCWCLRVTIDWQGRAVHIVNVHVASPSYDVPADGNIPWVRSFDSGHQTYVFDALLADLAEVDLPVVVLGDFNTADGQANYDRVIGSGLVDAQRQAGRGLGLTYPAPFTAVVWLPFPLIRIDYVFSGPSFAAVHFERVRIAGSDHLGVVADLVLREE